MVDKHLAALEQLPATPPSAAEAIRFCRRLAGSHYENFPVLSWLLPRRMRAPVAVLYAYCRTVDDVGDEAPGDRSALLDRFEAELDSAFAGRARHPVLVALGDLVERFDLPREPFERLIEANRIDQRAAGFDTFDDLLEYCDRSANPVGRLFLMLFGYRDEERFALSDGTCTALQLTNFWQDLRRDAAQGRIYIPREDLERFGVREADLSRERATDALRALVRFEIERTRRFFAAGLPLLDRVRGHLRFDLALFSRGGLAILEKIAARGYDPLVERPTLGGVGKAAIGLSTLVSDRWRRAI